MAGSRDGSHGRGEVDPVDRLAQADPLRLQEREVRRRVAARLGLVEDVPFSARPWFPLVLLVVLVVVALVSLVAGRWWASSPVDVAASPPGAEVAVGPAGGPPAPGGPVSLPGPGSSQVTSQELSGRASDVWAPYASSGFTPVPAAGVSAQAPSPQPAWQFRADASAGRADALAGVFAVAGEVSVDEWASTVTSPSGASVSVSRDAVGAWWFSDPSRDVWACASTVEPRSVATPEAAPSSDGGAGSAGGSAATAGSGEVSPPMPPQPCPPPAAVLSKAEARKLAGEVFAAVGVDSTVASVPGGGFVDDVYADEFSASVTRSVTVDGRRVWALSWSVTFTGDGKVAYASGVSGKFVSAGDVPVVSPVAALERLSERKWASFGPLPVQSTNEPVAVPEPLTSSSSPSSRSPEASGKVVLIEQTETVSSVRLSTVEFFDASSTLWLLPAYVWDVPPASGYGPGVFAAVAVDESSVAFTGR